MQRSELLRRTVATTLLLAGAPVFAQQPTPEGDPAKVNENRVIESIVVTAQKREQSLQDVPIVVTAVSEQLLKDSGVNDIKDLTLLTPGLLVTSTTSEGSTTARIRGVGTVGDNPGLESSVGIVIDGVYRPRNGVGFGDLGEIERIEVLKGPQGTLFGKNTSAGVINVISKRPSFDFGSQIELTAGNYGELAGSASLTGPLATDVLAGRLFVAVRDRDGLIDIGRGAGPRSEDEDFDRSVRTVRGQLLLRPADALDIRFVADYAERDENCCAAVQVAVSPSAAVVGALNGTAPGSIANPADPFARRAFLNRSTEQSIEDSGVSMEVNWELAGLGGATLTSITAWRNWEIVNGQDSDFTTADLLYRDPNGDFGNEFRQVSEELRLAGESDRLSWLLGAFYAAEDLDSRVPVIYGTQFQSYFSRLFGNPATITAFTGNPNAYRGLGQRDAYEQESSAWALFTNNTLRVTEALELTLGLRYTDESKDLDSRYANADNGVGCQALRNNRVAITNAINATVNHPDPAIATALRQQALQTVYGIGCATFADPIFNNLATRQSIDEGEWSGTAKIGYRFSDQVMTYASYARGYKAGGYNLDRERTGNAALNPGFPGGIAADVDTRFDSEIVDSYEVGAKTSLAGDSLLLNATVFYQDYENFQLNTFTGLQFVVTSLPQVTAQGVDLDMVWFTPLPQLSLQGGVTYADTQIDDFGTALGFFRPERENDRLSFAPKWSASLSATVEQPVGANFLVRGNLGAKYNSEYNTGSNLDPRKGQDAYTLLNARLGFGAQDEGWMLELWAQNLTDEEYVQVAIDAVLQGASTNPPAGLPQVPSSTIDAFLGAPRTYGLTARFKF